MTYSDLRNEELFVEASAIRFYMRQAGWVNRSEVAETKAAFAQEAGQHEEAAEQYKPQIHSKRNWIEWVRSL